jgi:ribosome-binding factor A
MTRRTDRVADAVQQAIAELLLREIKDPRIGMITITGVRISPDLRHARVFFSRLGGAREREQSLAGLRSAAGFIRSQITRMLGLRVAPEIVFEFDPGLEHAEHMSRLLRETSDREPER